MKMNNGTNYKLTISYDGKVYDGWQKQGNTHKTIQEKIETLLSRLEDRQIEIHGAGRTDAGVHAKGQVCSVNLYKKWDEEVLLEAMNEYLPQDIAVVNVEKADERFHARLSATAKTYKYRINNSGIKNVFDRNYVYTVKEKLNIEKMQQAATYLIGTHDFKAFCANKHMKKSTVRTIYNIQIENIKGEIVLTFYGNGFLYNMIRIITGTLIEVGKGGREPSAMIEILNSKNRQNAGFTAPPDGLILWNVEYSKL